MSESLKHKTFSGSIWSLADNLAGSGITFLVGLVLARLLEPAEYDVLGIIMIFVVVFNSIVDSGFSNALIRKNDATDVDYNTVFFFNLIISVILFGVLYCCAGVISSYFGKPILVPVTKVMASIVIINAFAIIQRTILVKNIDFKTQTKVSLIASIVSGAVGIWMALKGYGVWSLVGQQVSRQLMNSVFLWVFNKWRPGLTISLKSFKELFGFGWKLLVSGLIAQCILAFENGRKRHSDDSNRDGGFKHLSYLQSQIGCGCAEDDSHQNAPANRPQIDFSRIAFSRHHGFVLFALIQFAERIFGQRVPVFSFIHSGICVFIQPRCNRRRPSCCKASSVAADGSSNPRNSSVLACTIALRS